MSKFDRIVEEAIKKAISDGEFNNLSGFGKPIQWKDNPYTSAEMRLVDDLLQKNDLSYPWMEKRKEIEKSIQELRERLALFKGATKPDAKEISDQIASINKKIFDYNLSVPVVRLQRKMVSLEDFILRD